MAKIVQDSPDLASVINESDSHGCYGATKGSGDKQIGNDSNLFGIL